MLTPQGFSCACVCVLHIYSFIFCLFMRFRLERCNLCFTELEKVKRFLPSLSRYEFKFIYLAFLKEKILLFKPLLVMLVVD